jgi:adenylyltransferase/sulfurtransferase
MHDELVKRYTRQMVLPQFGHEGQAALGDAHILIIGLGGLGSPAAIYLAAAGIGQLTIADFDRVSISNLHRQILYTDEDIGHKKTVAAAKHLLRLNPRLKIKTIDEKITDQGLADIVSEVDIALDCCDNFATRYAINKICIAQHKPLVSGAAIRLEAQIGIFNLTTHSPCYACLYPDAVDIGERCSEVGVLGPLVGITGSMQALEAIKLLTGLGEPLDGRLMVFDAATQEWRKLKLNKDPSCPVCSKT